MSRLKILLWTVIAGLIATIGWLAFDHLTQVESTAQSVVNRTFAPLVQQFPLLQFGTLSEPTTVLFMGTDVVYEHAGRRVDPEPASYRGNSDSMMCIRLDPINDRLVVLQIPRDTEVTIGGRVRKVNAANPIGGPAFAEQTVSELLGCPIDHYVVMNVHGIVDLFNEVGGITIHVPKPMQYMDWTAKLKIDLEPGYHTLTGNQAMGFVRFRHDALGDIGRLQRQQIFMDACFRKVMDPACWLHAPAVIDIIQKNIDTDISSGDIVKMANFVHSLPKSNVVMVVLPGRFGNGGDWIASADVKGVVTRLFDPSQDAAACRRNISIYVENGTSEGSFGWKLAVALRKLGYLVSVGGNSGEPAVKTKIIAQIGNAADARMIQQDLGGAGEVVNASLGNLGTSITIVAGNDIVLDKICKSCPDAPYVAPVAQLPSLLSSGSTATGSQGDGSAESMPPASGIDGESGSPGYASPLEGLTPGQEQENANNGKVPGVTAIEGGSAATGTTLGRDQQFGQEKGFPDVGRDGALEAQRRREQETGQEQVLHNIGAEGALDLQRQRQQRLPQEPVPHDVGSDGGASSQRQREQVLQQDPVPVDAGHQGMSPLERQREASSENQLSTQRHSGARESSAASDSHLPIDPSNGSATSTPGSSSPPPLAPEGLK